MHLQDNTFNKIIKEIVLGVILLVVFLLIKNIGILGGKFNTLAKIIYSVGIVMVLAKILSFIACFILENTRCNMFWQLYDFIEAITIFLYILFWYLFHTGYLWLEIVVLILCAIWVLMDMNTVSCVKKVNEIHNEIEQNVKEHSKEVENFKFTMDKLLEKKDRLLDELEPYIKKNLFTDPLKNIRHDIHFPYIDRYLESVPNYDWENKNLKGLDGLANGRSRVDSFQYSAESYKNNLRQERHSLNNELSLYQKNIDILEKKIKLVVQSGNNISTMNELGFDSNAFKIIHQNDIFDAKGCDIEFKRVNRLHKKANKIRRRHKYGKK